MKKFRSPGGAQHAGYIPTGTYAKPPRTPRSTLLLTWANRTNRTFQFRCWSYPVAGAAKAAQVPRPGGRLAVFAHVFEAPPEVPEALTAVCRRVASDSPLNPRPPLTQQAV
jgi:hypothetical protein